MPLIESIEVCVARVPLDKVTYLSNRTVVDRHYGLVKVRSSDGVEGIGFCYVGNAAGELFRVAVEQLLGPVLLALAIVCGCWGSFLLPLSPLLQQQHHAGASGYVDKAHM